MYVRLLLLLRIGEGIKGWQPSQVKKIFGVLINNQASEDQIIVQMRIIFTIYHSQYDQIAYFIAMIIYEKNSEKRRKMHVPISRRIFQIYLKDFSNSSQKIFQSLQGMPTSPYLECHENELCK